MKKILALFLMLAIGVSLYAQTSQNRTTKTIVIDALAMLPAQNEADYKMIMESLLTTKEEGVTILGSMFSSVNNVPVNYALSGMAKYASRKGKEKARQEFANAIKKEVAKTTNLEVKKFYLRLLAVCGNNEVVPDLKKWLSDKELQATVAESLMAICTEDAKKALISDLSIYDKELAAHIIGSAKICGQEDVLIGWLDGADKILEKTILYALAQTGGEESLDALKDAAKRSGYTFEPTSATSNLYTLLKREVSEKYAYNEAKKLLKASKSAGQIQTMISAVELMILADKDKAKAVVLKSVVDENYKFRNGVLNLVKKCNNEELFIEFAELIEKADNPAKIDLITYLGVCKVKPAYDYIVKYISDSDVKLSSAAMLSAAKLNEGEAIIKLLCDQMIASKDASEINAATSALSYVKYGNSNAKAFGTCVAKIVAEGSPEAQIKAIELLASRRANGEFAIVASKLKDSNKGVSSAAYKALASVSGVGQLNGLVKIIFSAPEANIINVQNAIYAAISEHPKDKRGSVVEKMLLKAKGKESILYSVLTRMGDVSVLTTIANNFAAASVKDKTLSIEALKNWQGKPIFSLLSPIIESSNNEYKAKLWDVYLHHVATQNMTAENKRIYASNVLANNNNKASQKKAIQIIGNTKSYLGLLTVAPFMDNSDAPIAEAACQAVMKLALGNSSFCGSEIVAILEKCISKLNNPDASYHREAITKHISKLSKEGGYVSIFNGKDLTGWKGLVANPIARNKMSKAALAKAQVAADKQMRNSWSAKNGCMYFNGGGNNICTDKMYGDFEMLIDWRLYKGGKEADAGIYLRGTPQVQMWDISRTNVGAQVGSGGLYNNQKNASKPTKVMDNDMGEWNTFYIKMVGERVTVVLNGETVVDNVIMDNYWNRKLPIFIEEQIELQAHGSEVEYRNIYIKELEAVKPLTLSKEEKKDGFKLLFDGVSMNQWIGNTAGYVAEDGCIALHLGKGFGGNIYTKDQYSNFVLRFEFWLTKGANNGLGIRTPMNVDAAYQGMELQILDNEADIYANLAEYQYHGSVYGVATAKRGFQKPVGEWNVQEVIADGNRIKVTLNGTVILDVDIAEASANNTKTLDNLQHPGLLNKSGYIGFLGHGSHVKFKNIRIKELP